MPNFASHLGTDDRHALPDMFTAMQRQLRRAEQQINVLTAAVAAQAVELAELRARVAGPASGNGRPEE